MRLFRFSSLGLVSLNQSAHCCILEQAHPPSALWHKEKIKIFFFFFPSRKLVFGKKKKKKNSYRLQRLSNYVVYGQGLFMVFIHAVEETWCSKWVTQLRTIAEANNSSFLFSLLSQSIIHPQKEQTQWIPRAAQRCLLPHSAQRIKSQPLGDFFFLLHTARLE